MEVSNVQHQVMAHHPMEDVLGCSKPQQQQQEKRLRPHPEPALKCPRCDSANTKFCYYNNYSLSQPRYFCKGCRRYWTQGGSLRNVPVGGGCRKNKRSSSKKSQDQTLLTNPNPNPLLPTIPPPPCIPYGPSDLSLAFTGIHRPPTTKQLGLNGHENFLLTNSNPNPSICHMTCSAQTPGFLDILGSGLLDSTNTSGFHSLYYGFGGSCNVGEVEGGGEDVAVPFEGGLGGGATTSSSTATAPTSQGSCGAMGGEENKVVVGLQWHSDGEERRGADRGRNYWTGVASSSSWPGLINSPLMYR